MSSPSGAESSLNSLEHLRGAVFFEGAEQHQKLTRFWMLLILSSIIASAGVVSDSTATVIGAMIVAPLMVPILGVMLAVVLGDSRNLGRSIGLVLAGAGAAIAIGYAIGLLIPQPIVAATNAQVAGRVHPHLIDLLAALATGAVGSIALVRSDISDTLPGVAIAISLVPPLAVVGLTLESGAPAQAAGALLLFTTNVAAILAAGTIVMGLFRVHRLVDPQAAPGRVLNRGHALVWIAVLVLLVTGVLARSSQIAAQDQSTESRVQQAAEQWGKANGWTVASVSTSNRRVILRLEGPPPLPSTKSLVAALVARGVNPSRVQAQLIPSEIVDLTQPR